MLGKVLCLTLSLSLPVCAAASASLKPVKTAPGASGARGPVPAAAPPPLIAPPTVFDSGSAAILRIVARAGVASAPSPAAGARRDPLPAAPAAAKLRTAEDLAPAAIKAHGAFHAAWIAGAGPAGAAPPETLLPEVFDGTARFGTDIAPIVRAPAPHAAPHADGARLSAQGPAASSRPQETRRDSRILPSSAAPQGPVGRVLAVFASIARAAALGATLLATTALTACLDGDVSQTEVNADEPMTVSWTLQGVYSEGFWGFAVVNAGVVELSLDQAYNVPLELVLTDDNDVEIARTGLSANRPLVIQAPVTPGEYRFHVENPTYLYYGGGAGQTYFITVTLK